MIIDKIKAYYSKNCTRINKTKQNKQKENKDTTNLDLNSCPTAYYSKIHLQGVSPISDIKEENRHLIDNYIGCLLGGAIGDALGWPVEFRRFTEIQELYGENGITDLEIRNGHAEITDDTQMTIFTADGLLKSAIKNFNDNASPNMSTIYDSYQDWINTQYGNYKQNSKGWIANIKDLYQMRAPGNTCTSSLISKIPGSIEEPINASKGCGGVMRTAPVGLMYYKNPSKAFEVGAECAALTHGNPSAYLPAGVHSCIIANIVNGANIEKAVDNSIKELEKYTGNEDTLYLINLAKRLANTEIESQKAIKQIGEGWHGDEAIGIAVYCVLKSPNNFEKALIMAVNHDGDSDSTGAIVGNILGAYLGTNNIPTKWKNSVELSSTLIQIATDLYSEPNKITDSAIRYPITK